MITTTQTIVALKQNIVEVARQADERGLVANTAGNFSARDPETRRIFITPTGYSYDRLTVDDLVEVDLQGKKVDGLHEPSSEIPVHCLVYRERPDVCGVVHTEPPYVNCFGALGKEIAPVLVSLLLAAGGPVPVLPFQPSGSEAFGRDMLAAMGDRFAVIWGNHGLLTIGSSLSLAYERTVFIEEGARVYHLSLQLGTPHVLSRDLFGHIAL
jgi:ribulose-5-phosphate 4-epimerase/fuculose-1-phosphate aldolase